MRPDLYILEYLLPFNSYIAEFLCALALVFILNKLIVGSYINGLAFISIATSIVFTVIIDLMTNNLLTTDNFFQFCYVDAALFVVVLFMYKKFITHAKQINFAMIAEQLTRNELALIFIFLIAQLLITITNVNWDGSSRIAYQTQRWYTFVRLITELLNPLSIFLVFLLARCNRTFVALCIASLVVVTSVCSGSKAGFLFSFLTMFLLYRDLVGITRREVRYLYVLSIMFVTASLLNLYLLGITPDKLFERFVYFAESTIMLYPAADPTTACKDTSLISNIHRGIARLVGDSSATDIDTLFGYALSKEFYGDNTLTGPNARIGSYALCAFPGWNVLVLYTIIILYLSFSWKLFLVFVSRGGLGLLMICPFYVSVLVYIVMDYNAAMALLTSMIILMLFIIAEDIAR